MKENLEDLWFYYLIEVPVKKTSKENKIISTFFEKEKSFRSTLNQNKR